MILTASLLLILTGCARAVSISIEVSDDEGDPVKGAALSIVDDFSFKLHAPGDANGCIHAQGVPGRGGRSWLMTVDAPEYKPVQLRLPAAGRHSYAVVLQPDQSQASSTASVAGVTPRCTI
jgi:hypothetical protein